MWHMYLNEWTDIGALLLLFKNIYLFIWLFWVLFAAHRMFSCGMCDPVPWWGIEPGPPALRAQSLSHWTIREVSDMLLLNKVYILFMLS